MHQPVKPNDDKKKIVQFYCSFETTNKYCYHRKILFQDKQDTASLLSKVNINREELCRFALDTANIATSYKMPTRDFAKNHHDQDDIEIFDFTSMLTCKFSTLIAERHGHNLIMTMVGDGLVEVNLNKEV